MRTENVIEACQGRSENVPEQCSQLVVRVVNDCPALASCFLGCRGGSPTKRRASRTWSKSVGVTPLPARFVGECT